MIRWIIRKIGQLGEWSKDAAAAVQDVGEKFSVWSMIDFGAGVAIGVVIGKLVL